jgi:DNA-damage-inducible protein D
MENSNLIPFGEKPIRKEWHKEQWYFSIVDVIEVLTETKQPRRYWTELKKKLIRDEKATQLLVNIEQLKMLSPDNKRYQTDAANTEGVLRVIMSVPSPKAEPLKQWMAQVSTERMEETENPELGFDRLKEIYKAKGYSDEWIKERIQSIETRKRLTDEWQKRGVAEGQEYSLLTAVIAKGTFGLTPTEHKDFKGLTKPSQNLRDHMTPLELILTSFGEEVTRQFSIKDNVQGFEENHETAQKGGYEAGKARRNLEKKGLKVISEENFLHLKSDKTKELPTEEDGKEA